MNAYNCYSITLGQTLSDARMIHGNDLEEAAIIFSSTMDATNNNQNILNGSLIVITLTNMNNALDTGIYTCVGVAGVYVAVLL